MRAAATRCARRARWRRAASATALIGAALAGPLGGPAAAAPGDITTVAGGGAPKDGVGDGGLATQALLKAPWGLDESAGNLVVAENVGNRVRRVDGATGKIATLAGGGAIPLGDGGPATAARLTVPQGVIGDAAGNLYIADTAANRVRKVDAAGRITTLAGTGAAGYGDGTNAKFNAPLRLAGDGTGNVYVSDVGNFRIRRIDPSGRVSTVAGTVPGGRTPHTSSGDGGPALDAQFTPRGIALDGAGNLYLADIGDDTAVPPAPPRVRRITPGADGVVNGGADEVITTVAGGGSLPAGGAGEGAPATSVSIGFPEAVATDTAGNLYVTTFVDQRVFRVSAADGTIRTVAGTGKAGTGGDGGPATAAQVSNVFGVSADTAGNLFLAELDDSRVRRVDATTGTITTVAGDGTLAFGGDGGPATAAQLARAADVAAVPGGALLIADSESNRIRRVSPAGIITTVAGGGIGDGGPATAATLAGPRGVAADGAGTVYVADCGNQRVRRVAGGLITTYAGLVPFRCPSGLYLVPAGAGAGTLYVADAGAHQVFKVAPGGAPVTVVAGTGTGGFSGDGGQAAAAQLNGPSGVTMDQSGNLLVADTANSRVRRITPAGVITTVAGDGTLGIGFDGVAATATPVTEPVDVAVEPSGSLVIAETGLHRLRRVSRSGIISTVAGNGLPGYAGDGGPVTSALLTRPTDVDVDAAGALLFTDMRNRRVRRIEPGSPPPPPTTGCGQVITANTTLTADIGPCPGDGVVIGADRITLNLNGHTISGVDGSDRVGQAAGIRLYARKGVVIKGGRTPGTVRGFDAGIALIGGTGNTIQDVVVRDNLGPPTTDAVFGDGIGLFFSSGNKVHDNVVTHNGIYDGIGVLGLGADDNLIQDNVVTQTFAQGLTGPVGTGIITTAFLAEDLPREISVYRNRFLGNQVTGNDNSGISVISDVDGEVRDNVVDGNGHLAFPGNGIGVQNLARAEPATAVVVATNTVTGNGGDGIRITSSRNDVGSNAVHGNVGSGIHVEGTSAATGHGNTVHDNDAAGNKLGPAGYGDLVDFSTDPDTGVYDCDSNTWLRNVWGSGGYWPDPAVLGAQGPVACTTTGGTAAPAAATSAAAAATSRAAAPGEAYVTTPRWRAGG